MRLSTETTATGDGAGFSSGWAIEGEGTEWTWQAYGPLGREEGSADTKLQAESAAKTAEARLCRRT